MKKTPQQNEATKRMNRTLIKHERSMRMMSACLSAYALIPSDERTKLKPKSLEYIFLGFESVVKDNRYYFTKKGAQEYSKSLPTEDVHEVVESDTAVEEFRQQQQTQDDEEEEAQDHMELPSISTSSSKRTIKPPQ
ncbi:PREDICTED: gag-pol poly [Prunus dulcis]|uniref:PREDICTED: gag-pol poly n=1 Tax=Prunus dulcis TaxID=3755 RepID=A0A5E4FZ70_PRUDU|nr:PREDICTED: gag-pol poly [Prunus dulcis]